MEFMNNYIVPLILGICLCVGAIIKHVIPSEKIDRFIPLILGILGVGINSWVNAWIITPEIVMGGLFSGLASTGLNQQFRQFLNKFSGKIEE